MTNGSALFRTVVDTNLLVSGLLYRRGSPYELVLAILAYRLIVVMSPPLIAEYARVLPDRKFAERYGVDPILVKELLGFIGLRGHHAVLMEPLPVVVRDRKDEMVLATALGGRADFLVTGDNDLLALRDEPLIAPLRIVTVREFLDALAGSG